MRPLDKSVTLSPSNPVVPFPKSSPCTSDELVDSPHWTNSSIYPFLEIASKWQTYDPLPWEQETENAEAGPSRAPAGTVSSRDPLTPSDCSLMATISYPSDPRRTPRDELVSRPVPGTLTATNSSSPNLLTSLASGMDPLTRLDLATALRNLRSATVGTGR